MLHGTTLRQRYIVHLQRWDALFRAQHAASAVAAAAAHSKDLKSASAATSAAHFQMIITIKIAGFHISDEKSQICFSKKMFQKRTLEPNMCILSKFVCACSTAIHCSYTRDNRHILS